MKQDTKRLTSILVAALLLAGALIVYFELIVPTYGNLEDVKGQVESEAALYTNEDQIVTTANGLLAKYQNSSSSVSSVSLALPVGPNIADALAQIYGIASGTGFTVGSTAIATQAVTPQPVSTVATAATAQSLMKPTGSVTFQVSGTGTYESFYNFLKGLETNIRIFDVTGISIQSITGGGKGTASAASADNFNFTITVVSYYQAP